MPVSTAMNGGIAVCGLTRVWNSPSTSPPRTLTAPISVIIEPPGRAAGGLEVDDAEGDLAQRPAQLVEAPLGLPGGPRSSGTSTSPGEAQVEETELKSEVVETVSCRWCGRDDAIELVDRNAVESTED
jgi:hypothetical protein